MDHDEPMTDASDTSTPSSPTTEHVAIRACTDGPYEVTGPAAILADDGTVLKEGDKAYLCRCGQSERKPFCDGTHKKVGFRG